MIRITRIVYAFRNGVWPKPMEGLDLFTPVVDMGESSSESSESELESDQYSDSDYENGFKGGRRTGSKTLRSLTVHINTRGVSEEGEVDVEGDVSEKDFEIEKVRMVLRSSLTAHKQYTQWIYRAEYLYPLNSHKFISTLSSLFILCS